MSSFNWVDYVIVAIFAMSVITGLTRGFIKEVIALLTWIAAFIIALMFSVKLAAVFTGSQPVQAMVSNASSSIGMNATTPVSYLALGIAFILLFVGTLLVGGIINYLVSGAAKVPGVSMINRLLGAVFGLGRGFILVMVMIFLVQLSPLQSQPWWTQSSLVTSFQPAVQWLSRIVSPGLASLKDRVGQTLQNVNPQQMLQNVTGQQP